MGLLVLVVALVVLAILGAPLFAIFGAASMALFSGTEGGTITSSAVKVFSAQFSDSPTLVTLPLFTFAGYVLAESQTPTRLVRVSRALFGWVPGGLAIVCLMASAFFTTFTGGSGITIVAIGGLLYPALLQERYGQRFSLGLVTTGGSLGLLFPPSLPLLLYGVIAGLLIDKLFLAGLIPGAILMVILALYAMVVGWRLGPEQGADDGQTGREGFMGFLRFLAGALAGAAVLVGVAFAIAAASGAAGWLATEGLSTLLVPGVVGGYLTGAFATQGETRAAVLETSWEVLLPVVLLAGLMGGVLRIHEAAAVTALYVLVIEVFVYRDLSLSRDLPRVIRESMTMLGAILAILATALGFTEFLIDAGVPDRIVGWMMGGSIDQPWMFLLALNVFLLLVGMLMDIFSAIVVVVPLIVPIAEQFHVDPYHLGIIFLLNLEIGYLTPPVGLNLFISSFRFNKPVTQLYTAVLPFIFLLLVALFVTTNCEVLSTYLPGPVDEDALPVNEIEDMAPTLDPLLEEGGPGAAGTLETLDDLGGETLEDLDDLGGETLEDLDDLDGETLDDLEGETLDDLEALDGPEGGSAEETLDDLERLDPP